jgi:uncharacterized protein YndB with AHSA1/START domain
MKTIRQIYHINATIEKVWQALINPKDIDKWGGGPAKMDDKVGTKFKLWGGDVHGTNLEVVAHKKLVQEWYSSDVEGKTRVTFALTEKQGKTTVELTQDGVPEAKHQDLADGWKDYYMNPLKEFVEK